MKTLTNKFKYIVGFIILTVVLSASMITPASATDWGKIYNLKLYTYNDNFSVNWQTIGQYYSELHYGTDTTYNHKITADKKSDWHSYGVSGLASGTTYYYKILILDYKNHVVSEQTGEVTTTGYKQNLTVYKPYFYANFNNSLYSQSNQFPSEVIKPQGIKFTQPSIWQGNALQITDNNSSVAYSCDPSFNAGYGAVMAWIRITDDNKDMTLFTTDDNSYSIKFEKNSFGGTIVARAGYDKNSDEEATYTFTTTTISNNFWKLGEWHHVAMVWEGKLNGTIKLYIDGELKDTATFSNGGGCQNFYIGNDKNHRTAWSNGQIDDFKMFNWNLDSTSVRNEYKQTYLNQSKDVISTTSTTNTTTTTTGSVAGASITYYKNGKLLKDPFGRVYVITNGQKMHITDMDALKRFGNNPVIAVSWQAINQYSDTSDKFYTWSKFPAGTLLKSYDNSTIYYLGSDGLHEIPNESVFNKYGNEWIDVVEISQAELTSYPLSTPSN